ncbi:protein translocase subunit SecA-like [Tachysurus ichikawai]
MGLLGGEITVNNCTPYKWTVCIETQTPWLFPDRYTTLDIQPHKKTQQYQRDLIKWGKAIYLKVKYGQCSETECQTDPDLWYLFNPRDDPCFTIRESGDHWHIHLDCNVNYEDKKSTCQNYEKIKDDAREEEQKRRQDEEQRRQAQLERERRIEEQIKRESELAEKKLSQARETLKQKAEALNHRLRGHELHHQTHVIQQPLEAEIEIDEVTD